MNRSYLLKLAAIGLFALIAAMPLYSSSVFDVSDDNSKVEYYEADKIDGIEPIEQPTVVESDEALEPIEPQTENAQPKKKKGFAKKIDKLKKKGEKIIDYVKDVTKDESAYLDEPGQQRGQVERDKDYETKKALNKVYHSVKDAIENDGQDPKAEAPQIKGNTNGLINKIKSAFGFNTKKTIKGFEGDDINIDGDNYCGQYAMTLVLNQRKIDADAQGVYQDTNPAGIFTAPSAIPEYLKKHGVKAAQKNNASLEDIIKKVDEGKPALCLVDAGGSPHWVTIYGYKCDSDGNVTDLKMRDSYFHYGPKGGYMSIDEFADRWQSPMGKGFAGKLVGYSNLLIDIDGEEHSTLDTATEDNLAMGINNAVNGFKNKNWSQCAGGAAQLITGIPGAVITVASRLPKAIGDSVSGWGKEKIAKGGVGNKILGGLAVAAGTACKAVGKVADFIGDVASKAAKGIGKVTKKIGDFFSGLFSKKGK